MADLIPSCLMSRTEKSAFSWVLRAALSIMMQLEATPLNTKKSRMK
jgi:hypothetical protein